MDFTDASHPIEIAYFDRGPIDPAKRAMGGPVVHVLVQRLHLWFGDYTRRGHIGGLVPSKFLTQNEIDASNQVHFDELNVQNQPEDYVAGQFRGGPRLSRPADPQQRSCARLACCAERCNRKRSRHRVWTVRGVAQLKAMGVSLDKDADKAKTPVDAGRMHALAAIIMQQSGS